jgi:hypothetical protein
VQLQARAARSEADLCAAHPRIVLIEQTAALLTDMLSAFDRDHHEQTVARADDEVEVIEERSAFSKLLVFGFASYKNVHSGSFGWG